MRTAPGLGSLALIPKELLKLLFVDKKGLRVRLCGWSSVAPDLLVHLPESTVATHRFDVADARRARGPLEGAHAHRLVDALNVARPGFADEIRAVLGGAPAPTPAGGALGGGPDAFTGSRAR